MFRVEMHRALLFFSGVGAILLSIVLQSPYARDLAPPVVSVPEPSTASLFAIGGILAIAISLIRRRSK